MVEPLHSIQSSGAVAFNQSSRAESGAVAGSALDVGGAGARPQKNRLVEAKFATIPLEFGL